MYNLLALLVLCVGQVAVSDQLPPPVKYPVEVNTMADAQFFYWATEFNKRQEADLERRREKMTEPQYFFGTETEYNWNGYSDWYRGNYSGNRRTMTYPRRWHNPYYTGPGPLVIVNPYCRLETQ